MQTLAVMLLAGVGDVINAGPTVRALKQKHFDLK